MLPPICELEVFHIWWVM